MSGHKINPSSSPTPLHGIEREGHIDEAAARRVRRKNHDKDDKTRWGSLRRQFREHGSTGFSPKLTEENSFELEHATNDKYQYHPGGKPRQTSPNHDADSGYNEERASPRYHTPDAQGLLARHQERGGRPGKHVTIKTGKQGTSKRHGKKKPTSRKDAHIQELSGSEKACYTCAGYCMCCACCYRLFKDDDDDEVFRRRKCITVFLAIALAIVLVGLIIGLCIGLGGLGGPAPTSPPRFILVPQNLNPVVVGNQNQPVSAGTPAGTGTGTAAGTANDNSTATDGATPGGTTG